MRLWKGGIILAMAIAGAWAPVRSANAQSEAPAGWSLVYDFLVQNVCVDSSDKIIVGVSPLDQRDKCPAQRNLRIDEKLPYHKQDWPLSSDDPHRQGYSRNDDYPAKLGDLGTVVVQARALAQGTQVGGGLFVFSDTFVASGMTLDPDGFQVFYGPNCASPRPADRIKDAWIFVGRDFEIGHSGQALASLTRFPEKCPARLTAAFTQWRTVTGPVRVRFPGGAESKVPLVTLISDHFGGRDPLTANHLERFYFTRELGLIRWERWQNVRRGTRPKDKALAADLRASDKCEPAGKPPEPASDWVVVRCRQWTNLVTADSPSGDVADTRFLSAASSAFASLGRGGNPR